MPVPQEARSSQSLFRRAVSWYQSVLKSLSVYFHHRAFLPSIALSLLYFSVLAFAGQMVTYLLTTGYNSTQIGLVRTLSVILEISATWLAPIAMAKVGPIRSGLWFISWQMLCVAATTEVFWSASTPFIAATGLIGGVIASRVGLWGFDLSVQFIIQEVCLVWIALLPSPNMGVPQFRVN